MGDENEHSLLEEWDARENIKIYLKSQRFRVLRGAMNLLQEPYEMMFHTVAGGKENPSAFPAGSLMTGMTGANVPSVKPNSDRRNTMKPSTKDEAEGNFHQATGKLKEIAGKLSMNPKLEAEGTGEKIAGKVQEKIGQVKEVLGK